MSGHLSQLGQLVAIVDVRAESAYSWLGQIVEGDVARLLPHRIYTDFYLTGGPAPLSSGRAWRHGGARGPAVEALAAANHSHRSPQAGWTVTGREGPRIAIEREGLRLLADAGQIFPSGAAHGERVTALLPGERQAASGGFFTVMGGSGSGAEDRHIDRLYWNVRAEEAPTLVEAVSTTLDDAGVPFRMKVINDERGYARCDWAVVYTRRAHRERTIPLARRIVEDSGATLRPRVPALTLVLAPGLAFAEDPGGGESYGAHRSRMIGDALMDAWRVGRRNASGRLAHVVRTIRDAGFEPDRLHVGPDGGGPDPRRLWDAA